MQSHSNHSWQDTLSTAHSSIRRVAVLLFGASGVYQGPFGTGNVARSWLESCAQSFKMRVLVPLNEQHHVVDLFMSSNVGPSSGFAFSDDLVALYHPFIRSWHMHNVSSTRAEKFVSVLQLLCNFSQALLIKQRVPFHKLEWPQSLTLVAQTHSFVAATRPDILWVRTPPLSSLLQPERVVWPHPCEERAWRWWQCVSDMIITMPAHLLHPLFVRCAGWLFSGNLTHFDDLPAGATDVWGDRRSVEWHLQHGDSIPRWLASSAHMSFRCAVRQARLHSEQLGFLLSEHHMCHVDYRVTSTACSRDSPFTLGHHGPLTLTTPSGRTIKLVHAKDVRKL